MEMVIQGQNKPKIPTKRLKFHEIVKEAEEDRISALPDCLILEILSRLPSTKYAIQTGSLSKRWKHLWTLVPTIVFLYHESHHPWPDFVNKTLNQCGQLKLKKFEAHSCYNKQYGSKLNHWIWHAIRRNVEELNLRLYNWEFEVKILLDQYFFTSSCFTDLKLEGYMLNPAGTISWINLKSLCITFGNLDEDLIENVLSGSPLMETLVLEHCYGYRLLDITSKSVKKLVFSGYNDDESDANIIKIYAPNILLLRIRYHLCLWKVLLANVSSLVEADLNYRKIGHQETTHKEAEEEMLKGFIINLSHVKDLKIGNCCAKVASRLEAKGFNFPSNTRFSGVIYDWFESESDTDTVEGAD